MRALILVLALAMPGAGAAQPNPQLLASIENRLPYYLIDVDVSRLSLRQAAALHLTMVSGGESWMEKRRKLEAILRWEEEDAQ